MKIFGSMLMAAALLASPVMAENTPTLTLDLAAMPGMPVWNGAAAITPLAMGENGKPAVVVLRLPMGTVAQAAHATGDGQIRFATVLSGTMYFSDGPEVDLTQETAYGPGSMLLIDSGTKHWLSAHDDEVVVMLVAINPAKLAPPVQAQQAAAH
ncbi:MAG: hypothetical protein COB08_009120 [Rhodobacteraceae bacterium]|nr:hypothetical protein [Paracoccaceae bacterium]